MSATRPPTQPTDGVTQRRWFWPTMIGVTIAATLAIAAWMVWPRAIDFYTDTETIRVRTAETTPRDVLWQPPIPLSEHLNTTDEDYEPRLSWDGMTLYFVRGKTGGNADIFTSSRTPDGWTEPAPLDAINSNYDDLGPEPTSDGNAIYFYSDRPGGSGGYDIWVLSRKEDGSWGKPKNLGPNINSEYNDYGPACTPTRDTLFYASNRPLPDDEISLDPHAWQATAREARYARTYDLYRATLSETGADVAAPIAELNTTDHEAAPCVSPAGDFLYFCSNRPSGAGGFDLYRVRLFADRYGAIVPLENGINTAANELDPALTYLGFGLFFSSDRLPEDAPPPTTDDDAAPPNYNLYFSHSREVFADSEREAIDWGAILAAILANLWWLLLALLALLLLLLGGKMLRSRRLSLLARCLLASALLHLLLMLILSLWNVSQGIYDAVNRDGGTQITVARESFSDGLATQIRGNLTAVEMPTVQPVAQTLETPTPDFAPPQPSELVQMQPAPAPPVEMPAMAATPELSTSRQQPIQTAAPAREQPLSESQSATSVDIAMPLPSEMPAPQQQPDNSDAQRNDAFAEMTHTTPAPLTPAAPAFTAEAAPELVSRPAPPTETTVPELAADVTPTPTAAQPVAIRVDTAQRRATDIAPAPTEIVELSSLLPDLPQSEPESAPAENLEVSEFVANVQSPSQAASMSTVPNTVPTSAPQLVERAVPATTSTAEDFQADVAIEAPSAAPIEVAQQDQTQRTTDVPTPTGDFDIVQNLDLPALDNAQTPTDADVDSNEPALPAVQVASAEPTRTPNVAVDQLDLEIVAARESSTATNTDQVQLPTETPAVQGSVTELVSTRTPPRAVPSTLDDIAIDLELPERIEAPPAPPLAQRAPEERERSLKQFGGNEETEAAVRRALKWLAQHQDSDGSWNGHEFADDCECGGESEHQWKNALTGLSLLCFLGAGHTHVDDGEYQKVVAAGLNYLTESQLRNGDVRGKETMYSHGIATIALCEAYAMTQDDSLLGPATRAARFIVRSRSRRTGGWRYEPGQNGDTSVVGWQVMALHSARNAGLEFNEVAFVNAGQFMDNVESRRRPGLYGYRPRQAPTRTMTAEGIFVRQLLGMEATDEKMQRAIAVIRADEPEWGDDANTYYWYYATLALYNVQGPEWRAWNDHLSEMLVNEQVRDGHEEGSWDCDGEWADIGSRVYQTALCTLMLEVYYRYLPMYGNESPRSENRNDPRESETIGS